MIQRIFRTLVVCLALFVEGVSAQTIDSLAWVEGVSPPVARITFAANVRFLRQAPAASTVTDLAQVGIQIVAGDEAVQAQTIEEGRKLLPSSGRSGVELTYVPMAKAATKLLTLRFTEKVALQVRQGPGARTIDLEIVSATGDSPYKLPPMAELPADRHFAVVLQTLPVEQSGAFGRIPSEFQDYAVSSRPSQTVDKAQELVVGYFRTASDADRVRQRALKTFPMAIVLSLDAKPSVAAATPLLAPEPLPPLKVAAESSDTAGRGLALLEKGRQAVSQRRYQEAVDVLNEALTLPPNPSSPETQELAGVAWEGLGNADKARAEYQLYQKLYPQGEASQRVAQRLSALGAAPKVAITPVEPAKKKRFTATGSVSQYYYGGNTKTDSLVTVGAGIDQNTLTRTAQSVVVSSWDATGRYLGDESETKVIMRGARSDNLMSSSQLTSTTQGLISAAYVDYRDFKTRLDVRLGRQSAIGGSLFGLFDGISVAMPVGSSYKVDAMLGVPANQLVTAPQQRMVGVMLEADQLFDHWGGNLSLVEQTTEGISDRRAVGMEVRYFGDAVSMFSQIDYDINFNALNALTLQGSFQGPSDTTISVLVDDRKAPSLQLSDALISSGQMSLATLLQLKSLNEVQAMALDTAAQARQAMVSVSRQLAPKWQGSMDLRYSEIGALPAVGNFLAQPATGAQYNVSAQLTGSNLYSSRDINGFSISYLTSSTINGVQLAYNNLTGIWDNRASLEPSIRYYTQSDNTDTRVTRISPGLRISYKLSPRANVMGEGIYETSTTDGLGNHETSSSMFFYVGYRYDFQ